jgi:hypothetical protein
MQSKDPSGLHPNLFALYTNSAHHLSEISTKFVASFDFTVRLFPSFHPTMAPRPKTSQKRGSSDSAQSTSKRSMKDSAKGLPQSMPLKPRAPSTSTSDVKYKTVKAQNPKTTKVRGYEDSPVSTPSIDSKRSVASHHRGDPVINPFPTRRTEECDVFVFGAGSMGELGLGATSKDRNVKRPRLNAHLLAGKVGIVDVAVGGMHVAALDKEGIVWTWGVNDQGSLGRDTKAINDVTMKDSSMEDSDSEEELLNELESKPGLVEGFPEGVKVMKLACGDSISVAIADDGMVYSWGTFRVI